MKTIFLAILAIILIGSCTIKPTSLNENTLLSINFDKNQKSVFAANLEGKLKYTEGIKGEGLDLTDCKSDLTINNSDTTWFSNDKDFSVVIWVKSSVVTSDTTIILSNSDFRKKEMGIYGNRRTNKGISLYSCNGSWGWNIGNGKLHYLYEPIQEDQPIADNQWHQLAFTYKSTLKEIRLFYDGINKAVLKIGDLDNQNFLSELPLRVGGIISAPPYYNSFNGTIDELKVWNKTLSIEDIRTDYNQFFAVAEEPQTETGEITVVNWNIWHGGTHFIKERDGFDGIERTIELIKNADADIVLMQETYGAGSRISSSLGFYYYEASSTIGAVWGANLSVMSRFPLEDAYMIEKKSNFGKNYAFNNGGVKVRLSPSKSIIAFSNWYSGGKPEDLDGALTELSSLIENADNTPIVYSGDFNSRSHLDDGEGKSGHSKLMEKADFTDSYRSIHPDIEAYPGYTMGGSARIDYIYYKGGKLKLIESGPIVPNFKGRGDKTPGYPSDHLGLVAKFNVD